MRAYSRHSAAKSTSQRRPHLTPRLTNVQVLEHVKRQSSGTGRVRIAGMSNLLIASGTFGFLAIAVGLAYHFAGLAVFNALVPKDRGSKRIASGIAFGPEPRQHLDLYAPKGAGPFPVLAFVYGGSWDSGAKEDYAFVGRALAAQGFVVAIADYRLVPHFRYPIFVDDVAQAITWLLAHAADYGGDPQRLFAMGHSAGAYNLVQAMLRHDLGPSIRAITVLAGPFDFLPLDSPKSIAAFAHADDLAETQPVNADLSQSPPMLLLHGVDDHTVYPRNSRALHAALNRAGRPAQLTLYDDIGHVGIMLVLSTLLRNRAPVLADAIAFFQKYD